MWSLLPPAATRLSFFLFDELPNDDDDLDDLDDEEKQLVSLLCMQHRLRPIREQQQQYMQKQANMIMNRANRMSMAYIQNLVPKSFSKT